MFEMKNVFRRALNYLVAKRWKLRSKLGRNNTKINRLLFPVSERTCSLNIPVQPLMLTSADYQRMVATPALRAYRKLSFVHDKPLQYLTSATLLDLREDAAILDAAGGSRAEYLRALRAFLPHALHAYCQDSVLRGRQLDGVTLIGGSAESIPLPDASLDGVSCHHSFEHFRDDLDIKFLHEAVRLLREGGKLVITPIFLTNQYAEIWNVEPAGLYDPRATRIYDRTASFAGWGPYEGFARTYSPEAFETRIVANLPDRCRAELFQVLLDGEAVPDISKNVHQPLLNAEMKALVVTRTA